MTYVVTEACIKCKYMDCVEVCPVDCFYEGENMLVINPDECIDCGVCEPECPPNAILPDTEKGLEKWLELNRSLSGDWPNITRKGEAPADADDVQGRKRQVRKVFQQRARQTLESAVFQSFHASFDDETCSFAWARPLPKCNIARDSGPNFWYKGRAGSGPGFGPPLARCPSRYPKATYRYRASGRARRGACAVGRGIAETRG